MHKELWNKIVVVHNTSKSFFLWCEENSVQLKTFLQPNNELKNAWEHVVRGKAVELGLQKSDNPQYAEECLKDALSHEYRAFFDICDWLSLTLRKRAIDQLSPYDHETIAAVIPDYYTKIRPNLDRACNEIAKLRGAKDIARPDILDRVVEYDSILKELIKDVQQLGTFIPTLEEYKKSKKAVESKKWTREFWVGIIIGGGIIAIIGAAALAVCEHVFSAGK